MPNKRLYSFPDFNASSFQRTNNEMTSLHAYLNYLWNKM